MVTFQRESVAAVLAEIGDLASRHWAEVDPYSGGELKLEEGVYLAADAGGMLRLFTARASGGLCGYAVFFVRSHPHSGQLQAVQEALFLAPAQRRGPVGLKMIEHCEHALSDEGVRVIYHSAPVGSALARILPAVGYEPVETVYAKRT